MQFNSTFSALSGKLGGTVATHGRIGGQLRAGTMRTQPRSVNQQANRRLLPALASAWRQLTPAQKAGWAGLALQTDSHDRLGQRHHPSAYTLFLSCNRNLQSIGVTAIVADAPNKPSLPAITHFTASAVYDPLASTPTLAGFALNYQLTATTLAQALLKVTPAVSIGRGNIRPSEYRPLQTFPALIAQDFNVYTLWQNLFGNFPASGQIGFMLKLIDPASGFAAPAVTAYTTFAQAAQPIQPRSSISIYVNPDLVAFAPIGEIDVGSDIVAIQKP